MKHLGFLLFLGGLTVASWYASAFNAVLGIDASKNILCASLCK